MKTKTCLFCLTIALCAAVLAFGQTRREVHPEKEREVRKFLALTGASKTMTNAIGQMIGQFRKMLPDVPKEFFDGFEKEINPDELITLVMPIYDKHLSLEDIKAANAFYESPAGKRIADQLPIMTAESMEIGRKWGEAKGRLVEQRLKDKGMLK